jgi:alkylhydroperoxidase family enzyme
MARVPYVTEDELAPEYQDLIVSSLQPGKRVNVYSAIGNNQTVLGGMRDFLGALWSDSGLTARQRELVILSAASEIGSGYEWHQHVNIADDVGIKRDEMRAIGCDDRSPFSDKEQVLLAYTRAVVRGRVTDSLYDEFATHFDDETLVGTTNLAAGYLAFGRVIDALNVDLESDDEFVGWAPK